MHSARRWNTPQLLRFSLYLLWAADVLFLCAVIAGVRTHRDAMKTLGRDTAPSIIEAQHVKSAIAEMDANAATELLGKADQSEAANKAYLARRVEASRSLLAAAESISYGDVERRPWEALETGLATYGELVQRARDLRERKDPQFLVAYRQAATLVDQKLYPAADALDKANRDVLDRVYENALEKSQSTRAGVLIAGLALIFSLLSVQSFLTRRTRRTLNLALLVATGIAVIILLHTNTALADENRELKVAKHDAFDSIHVLWRARALAYAARADESRYLLDDSNATLYEDAFQAKAKDITDKYIPAEMNNITFGGEREAASGMQGFFKAYLTFDQQIRALRQAGKRDAAIASYLGSGDFDRFDKALEQTLDINQKEFDRAVQRGDEVLSNFEPQNRSLLRSYRPSVSLGPVETDTGIPVMPLFVAQSFRGIQTCRAVGRQNPEYDSHHE